MWQDYAGLLNLLAFSVNGVLIAVNVRSLRRMMQARKDYDAARHDYESLAHHYRYTPVGDR